MTEKRQDDEGTDAEEGSSGTGPGAKAGSDAERVRDVVGRRGYDEAEDEQATEDEQH